MDLFIINSLSGVSGGIFGVFAGYFGFRARICGIEKSLSELAKNVRYEVTCDKMHEAQLLRLDSIEEMQKETRKDIKKLLERKE